MPKLKNITPNYRKHKPTGQAVVTIASRDHYLGPHGTKASKTEYDRLIGEWLAAGRPTRLTQRNDITIAELAAAYLKFALRYYRKDGELTGAIFGVKVALRWLKKLYGKTEAENFGPLALKAIRQRMIETGNARTYVNDNVARIRRIFKWAASEELVSAAVFHSLQTVDGLRKGRTEARETDPVQPVADEIVDRTLPKLPAVVADMVRFQRLTGCRPGEVCGLRPCDVDNENGDCELKALYRCKKSDRLLLAAMAALDPRYRRGQEVQITQQINQGEAGDFDEYKRLPVDANDLD